RGLWLTLGGENGYARPVLADIDAVFELIANMQESGILLDVDAFEERLSQLYADVSATQENSAHLPVELLTLHKAKGLEFDTVIIPYLHKLPKRNDPALLRWFEYTLGNRVDLLLAPYRLVSQEYDPLYRYVDHCLSQKDRFEMARLLYVGATRAKNRLYLLGEYEVTDKGEVKSPLKGSFWDMLWPYVEQDFLHEHDEDTLTLDLNEGPNEKLLRRLKTPFNSLKLQQDLALPDDDLNRPQMSDYVARCAGTVFHRLLQRLTDENSNEAQPDVLKVCELALKRMGLIGQELLQASTLIREALNSMLADEKGRWIMDPRHQERQREWALSVKTSYGIEHYVIDFSFI
ncbi:MAG TPA: 3'-5' exonuclease, partial [Candidatus Berkiella sp.]|nr:3'-5' exonuclease [Candidatus Berkiella sp.]